MATYSECPTHVNDNFETPIEVWKNIKHLIPNDKKIWCPFYCDGQQKQH